VNLTEYLEGAQPIVAWETYSPENDKGSARAFDVELRLCTKADLEFMRRKCMRTVWTKSPNGGRERGEETNVPELRKFLATCITNWKDLTYGMVAALGNLKAPPNGDRAKWTSKPVPCDD